MLPIEVQNVSYLPAGREVLQRVHLTIARPGITALLGPNGAGKSMLLRLLAGLLTPQLGQVRWNGLLAPSQPIAMMFQQPMLLRSSTAANVAIALKSLALTLAQRRQRVGSALEQVGLAHRAQDSARQLSGGERQRLALARAWVSRSTMMMLDEPTAALDPSGVDAIERIIGQIASSGTTIIMTTHSLAQAMRLANDVVFIANGKVLEHTTAADFFERPQSSDGQRFIRAELPWHSSMKATEL